LTFKGDINNAALPQNKEVFYMSRQGLMSEALKQEIAKKLGVEETVAREGWGGVSARNCGNIVREAIEMAEKSRT
jgi:small acid-soluble spore protein F (minor alpha/beta-type SASP)